MKKTQSYVVWLGHTLYYIPMQSIWLEIVDIVGAEWWS